MATRITRTKSFRKSSLDNDIRISEKKHCSITGIDKQNKIPIKQLDADVLLGFSRPVERVFLFWNPYIFAKN